MTDPNVESLAIPNRLTSRRLKLAMALALVVVCVGGWLVYRRWVDPWPARLVLATGEDDLPLMFSPDGRTFLTAGPGGIVPWDARTGSRGKAWLIEGKREAGLGAFSPDGRTFAVELRSDPSPSKIALYDVASGRLTATIDAEEVEVHHLAFSADGRTLRAVLGDKSIVKQVATWDVATARETSRRPIATRLGIPAPSLTNPAIHAMTRDGKLLATTRINAADVEFIDLESDRSIGTLIKPTVVTIWQGLAFSDDGKTLAIGRTDGAVEIWDVATRTLTKSIPVHSTDYGPASIRFLPDGRGLISDAQNLSGGWSDKLPFPLPGVVEEILWQVEPEPPPESFFVDLATGKSTRVAPTTYFPILSPDGRTMATQAANGTIKLRDLPPNR